MNSEQPLTLEFPIIVNIYELREALSSIYTIDGFETEVFIKIKEDNDKIVEISSENFKFKIFIEDALPIYGWWRLEDWRMILAFLESVRQYDEVNIILFEQRIELEIFEENNLNYYTARFNAVSSWKDFPC